MQWMVYTACCTPCISECIKSCIVRRQLEIQEFGLTNGCSQERGWINAVVIRFTMNSIFRLSTTKSYEDKSARESMNLLFSQPCSGPNRILRCRIRTNLRKPALTRAASSSLERNTVTSVTRNDISDQSRRQSDHSALRLGQFTITRHFAKEQPRLVSPDRSHEQLPPPKTIPKTRGTCGKTHHVHLNSSPRPAGRTTHRDSRKFQTTRATCVLTRPRLRLLWRRVLC